jgi:hypothetical protein
MSANGACFILCHELTSCYNMFKTISNGEIFFLNKLTVIA